MLFTFLKNTIEFLVKFQLKKLKTTFFKFSKFHLHFETVFLLKTIDSRIKERKGGNSVHILVRKQKTKGLPNETKVSLSGKNYRILHKEGVPQGRGRGRKA